MAKILVVEDNNEINAMLCEMLRNENIASVSAYSGTEAMLHINQETYDCILLDLMLPGKSGEETLQDIRKLCHTPVIIISAKSDIEGRVELLENGADDYIVKPFDLREVMARIRLQLNKSETRQENTISHGELVLNREQHIVVVNGKEIGLTRQEYNILELLLLNPQKVFTKQELFERAWEEYYFGADKTINVHISNIRNKIKQASDQEFIETVWGIGFRLKSLNP